MPKKEFDQETINLIISLYEQGKGVNEVGKEIKTSGDIISRILKENGIVLRKPGKQKTTSQLETKVIELYQQGNSYRKIEELIGVGFETCRNILKRNGIQGRTLQETNREQFFNENIFESIDTEEKAYWLGFISADGTITNKSYKKSVGLVLQIKDKDHLYKFNSFFGSNYPIREEINTGNLGRGTFLMGRLVIVSPTIVEDLVRHLKEPKKGNRSWYYEEIQPELERHYFRGLFDGDGSLIYADYPILTMCGNKGLMTRFHEICKELGSGTKVKLQERHSQSDYQNLNILQINGRQVLPIAEYLYKDANIYLNRKKYLADMILNNCYKVQKSI